MREAVVTPELKAQVLDEVQQFMECELSWSEISESSRDALFSSHEEDMPYGVKTGDDETADSWILDVLTVEEVLDTVEHHLDVKIEKGDKIWI